MSNQSANQSAVSPQRSPSTGPRTETGKAVSSQNARKHDLCSRTLRLTPEEWAEYNGLCSRYRHDFQPSSEAEQTLIDEICFNYWRLQQAREIELQMIDTHPAGLNLISLYIRYRTSYERGFYKALDRLHKIQADRRKQPHEPLPRAAASLAATPLSGVRSADSISSESGQLQEKLEDHLTENRVRAELLLPPLPLPKPLKKQVDQFVSKNPTASHKQLNDLLKRAA